MSVATFDNIKVGDKVIYTSHWGTDVVATITKVTKAGNFTTDKTGNALWDKYGHARGSDKWDRSRITEYSEERAQEIMKSRIINKAINLMHKCSKSDLTVDQAKAIIEILEDN